MCVCVCVCVCVCLREGGGVVYLFNKLSLRRVRWGGRIYMLICPQEAEVGVGSLISPQGGKQDKKRVKQRRMMKEAGC